VRWKWYWGAGRAPESYSPDFETREAAIRDAMEAGQKGPITVFEGRPYVDGTLGLEIRKQEVVTLPA
jgi:hypothetical protein